MELKQTLAVGTEMKLLRLHLCRHAREKRARGKSERTEVAGEQELQGLADDRKSKKESPCVSELSPGLPRRRSRGCSPWKGVGVIEISFGETPPSLNGGPTSTSPLSRSAFRGRCTTTHTPTCG